MRQEEQIAPHRESFSIKSFEEQRQPSIPSHFFMQTVPQVKRSKTLLPPSFKPLPYSVLIGRGKEPAKAVGNQRLKVLVELQLSNYENAKSRLEKSAIVSNILEAVRGACPGPAFVKFDGTSWWEVDDSAAREKIGALFRDRLGGLYKSSAKSKMARRRASAAKAAEETTNAGTSRPSK